MTQLTILVSQCLLGEPVRYDGRSKPCPMVRDELAKHARLVPLCPEVAAGFGIPRPPIEVADLHGSLGVVRVETREDVTAALAAWLEGLRLELLKNPPAGAVLKARSPSCGITDVPIFHREGGRRGWGSGLFAAALASWFPGMPLVSDEELTSPEEVSRFLERAGAGQGR